MKRLTCEMCGSTDLLKQDGVFVCQSCGCKYSVEEAKKMMIEGTVDVSGSTVKIDNSEMINNYLNLATNAIDSSNNEEAESYANKVIELDPQNGLAWVVKGAAAGWQTTGANNRFNEAVDCWKTAIGFMDSSNIENSLFQINYITSTAEDLTKAIANMHCNNFVDYRSKDNETSIENNCNFIQSLCLDLAKEYILSDFNLSLIDKISTNSISSEEIESMKEASSRLSDLSINLSNVLALIINAAGVSAYKQTLVDFGNTKEERTDYSFKNYFVPETTCILDLFTYALQLSNEIQSLEQIYKNYYELQNDVMDTCSYEYSGYSDSYVKSLYLTNDAKRARREMISEVMKIKDSKIAEIKAKIAEEEEEKRKKEEEERRKEEEERKQRIDKYWEEHQDEKNALQEEKKTLDDKINVLREDCAEKVEKLEKEKDSIQGQSEIDSIREKIKSLTSEKDSLGIFKGKEKKAIQEKIDSLTMSEKDIQDRMKTEKRAIDGRIFGIRKSYENEINPLASRIKEINMELEKDR